MHFYDEQSESTCLFVSFYSLSLSLSLSLSVSRIRDILAQSVFSQVIVIGVIKEGVIKDQ